MDDEYLDAGFDVAQVFGQVILEGGNADTSDAHGHI
jgi:hypothetical protein